MGLLVSAKATPTPRFAPCYPGYPQKKNREPPRPTLCDALSRTLFRATNIGFINLDRTRQPVTARPDHGAAQLVQPGPGSFVAAKPQFPLEAERTDSILLAGDEPHRQKPHPQRLTGTLEDRPGGERYPFAASSTPQPSPCHHPWLPRLSAMGSGCGFRRSRPRIPIGSRPPIPI